MAYDFSKITILIVEDNKATLELMKSIIQTFGAGRIVTALDGEEGFRKFCSVNPDLVITDWLMSPCDGIELSYRIRNDRKSPNQFVPIILMTGFSEKRRVIEARDKGTTEFLVKPFNIRDLYKRLQRIIERPRKFVRCDDFFGPDRRRDKNDTGEYSGAMRRATDRKIDDASPSDSDDVEFVDFK